MLTRLQQPGFPLWSSVSCICVCFIVLYVLKHILRRKHLAQILPGMKIGLLDIWGDAKNFQKYLPQKYSNCYNVYILQALCAYAQLFRKNMFYNFWFSTVPFIVIVKAEAVEQLIAGARNMEKAWVYSWLHPWLNTGLLTSHGQKWKSRRRLLTPSFHFDILKDFLPVFNEQSQMLVNVFNKETEKDHTDISMPVTLCTLDIICETTLGVSINAQKNSKSEYVQAILRVSSIFMHRMLNPTYFIDWIFQISSYGRQFQKDVNMLHDFTRSVIRKKKEEILQGNKVVVSKKRKALMDLLLEHHLENATLSEEDIREEVDTFTFEGHDTTSMGVVWALYLIGLYKDVQDKVHKELDLIFGDDVERPIETDDLKDMEYLDRVLKESQRLYPSVPMFSRTSGPGTVLNGHEIPEGIACLVLTYELHRDPDVFPNPEKFDPDRFLTENSANRHPYAYIPFSAGPRNCIGQRFAVMEEKIIVAHVLRNFSLDSLESRDETIPAAELILRNALPLKIRIRKRTR